MKKSYSFFALGLFAVLMFCYNPGFARSDQDIGFSTEIVTSHVAVAPAIFIPEITAAAADAQTDINFGTESAVQKMSTMDDIELLVFRRQGWRVVYNFPILNILPLSLPPPVKRE